MAKRTFVLRFRGDGPKPAADVERIRNLPEATVLDESSTRMMRVQSEEQPLRDVVESLDEWVVAREQSVAVPDTRKRIKGAHD